VLSRLVERRILAIDWDHRNVRVVHALLRKRGPQVLSVQSCAIPPGVSPGHTAEFGRLIRDFLDQEGISTRNAVVDIPRDQAVVKMLRGLPPASPADMPGLIAMRFERELSFPASQAAIDFAESARDEQTGAHNMLVAAVQTDLLADYRAICEAAGLTLKRVGLRPFANCVSVNAVLDGARHERVLFVDVAPALTEIDVIHDGRLVFTRAASVHVPENVSSLPPPVPMAQSSALDLDEPVVLPGTTAGGPTDLDKVLKALVVEVTRSIEAYRADDPGAPVNHVVIGGDSGVEEALADALRDRFGVTAELFNPAACLGWDADRGAAASGFAAALGLVLGQAGEDLLHFDFLHPKRTVSTREKQLRKLPMVAAVAVVFVLAGTVAYVKAIKPDRDRLTLLEKQNDAYARQIRDYEKFQKLIAQVDAFEEEQIIWIDELNDVMALLPDNQEMVLEDIDLRQKDQLIKLKMKIKDRELGTQIVEDLEAFRVEGQERKHFEANLGSTQTGRGEYPVTGSVDVNIVGRRPRPDLQPETVRRDG
jgi:type IV pilus assembly protein PilM